MKTFYILANWKMNCLQNDAQALAHSITLLDIPSQVHVTLFPPFTSLAAVRNSLDATDIKIGAQDCSMEAQGAFTGDISAAMLRDAGCRYVILGHSERRQHHQESDEIVRKKVEQAIAAGLIPVICVGENLAEREQGIYLQVIEKQIKNSLPASLKSAFLIAYEPVWAIGSGKTPTLAEITQVHKTIASLLTYATSGAPIPILYGGSVKAANAREILAADGVDGVLVGGASLNASEFNAIIQATIPAAH